MADIERGDNWIKFEGEDAGYDERDTLELIMGSEFTSVEIQGECSGHGHMSLSLSQLAALRCFLVEKWEEKGEEK